MDLFKHIYVNSRSCASDSHLNTQSNEFVSTLTLAVKFSQHMEELTQY